MLNTNVKTALVVTAIGVVVVYEVRSRRAIMEQLGSEPVNKATAYYGAMTLYGNLAEYFGRKAILAETGYWKVVRSGGN